MNGCSLVRPDFVLNYSVCEMMSSFSTIIRKREREKEINKSTVDKKKIFASCYTKVNLKVSVAFVYFCLENT